MLLHQSELPFFAVTGDYYPLSSTPSTLTQTALPGALFALPLPSTVIHNYQAALRRLADPKSYSPATKNLSLQQTADPSTSSPLNPTTPSTMPKQSAHKTAQQVADNSNFPAPHVPVIVGSKRDASGNAVASRLTASSVQPEAEDQRIRLPPKLKEAERMMHVQRWVNHLPGPATDDGSPDGIPVYWGYSNSPGFRNIDEDRELTPPPSRLYLSRLPFTPEEEQIMMRFFSHNSDYRHHPLAPGANMHNSFPANTNNNHHHPTYLTQRPSAIQQAPTTNQHFTLPTQQTTQGPTNGDPDTGLHCLAKSGVYRRAEQDCPGGNRFFADWEIRLISHLFHEYFPGRPEPMGNSGILPSVGEVRSRIASSQLKETRSATAVRAKIKRMQSSGTWIEFR